MIRLIAGKSTLVQIPILGLKINKKRWKVPHNP